MARKKILLCVLVLFITLLLIVSTFVIYWRSQPVHTLIVTNTTNCNVRFLILWSVGTSSGLITLKPNDKINLCKSIRIEGHSEIFVNINCKWHRQQVNDYACPNINTKSVFKIQLLP
jgi:hypothetical protein